MNYIKTYIRLIRRAQERTTISEYSERHHIFPQALYGKNDKTVFLTAREHLIAHQLIWMGCRKRYGVAHSYTRKMFYAFNTMSWNAPQLQRVKSRQFEVAREAASYYMRGDQNPSKRSDVREKISISKKGQSRPDMKGKRYFGAADEVIESIKKTVGDKKRGVSTNYPKNRKKKGALPPDTKNAIREARNRRMAKWLTASRDEVGLWISTQKKYDKAGRVNINILQVLKLRGERIDEYC